MQVLFYDVVTKLPPGQCRFRSARWGPSLLGMADIVTYVPGKRLATNVDDGREGNSAREARADFGSNVHVAPLVDIDDMAGALRDKTT